jgi:hypothetical protein
VVSLTGVEISVVLHRSPPSRESEKLSSEDRNPHPKTDLHRLLDIELSRERAKVSSGFGKA